MDFYRTPIIGLLKNPVLPLSFLNIMHRTENSIMDFSINHIIG